MTPPAQPRKPPPLPYPGAAAPGTAAVRTIGVALIALAVVRLGFAAATLVRMPFSVFSGPAFLSVLLQAFILPAALGLASLAAGILAVMQLPVARPFGLTVCSVVVLFQLYAGVRVVYLVATGAFRIEIFPWTVWVLIPLFLLVHAAAIFIFLRWQPAPRPVPAA